MSESEHSDSEFYYPGELLDAEMLQLPIHNDGYLYFGVCKRLVVPIHFTGLPNKLHEIIGSLKMRAEWNNTATRVSLFHQKIENEKKNGHLRKCLLTEWGRAGRENMWLSVRMHGPRCIWFIHPDLEPNIFPSGPPTQSISTYYICCKLLKKWNSKLANFHKEMCVKNLGKCDPAPGIHFFVKIAKFGIPYICSRFLNGFLYLLNWAY